MSTEEMKKGKYTSYKDEAQCSTEEQMIEAGYSKSKFVVDDKFKYIILNKEETMLNELKGQYVMIRTLSAGVFAGTLVEITENGKLVKATNARRIWSWEGAASLSELATVGTCKPESCKFPCEVPFVILTEVSEILPISEIARKSIASVPIWSSN